MTEKQIYGFVTAESLHFSFNTANACFPNVIFRRHALPAAIPFGLNNVDDALGQLPRIPKLKAVSNLEKLLLG